MGNSTEVQDPVNSREMNPLIMTSLCGEPRSLGKTTDPVRGLLRPSQRIL